MSISTKLHRGTRRRTSIVSAVAVLVGVAGIAVVNSGAGAISGPQPVQPPTEPANQLTVNVAADGTLSLPFRSTLACDVSFCPPSESYTDIEPGRTSVIINDPSGARARVQFGKAFSRNVGPRNRSAHARPTLQVGQLTVYVTIAKQKVARLVLVVEPSPYATSTTSSSADPTSSSGPTASDPIAHSKVFVTLNPGGEGGTLSVSPSEVPAGLVDIEFDVPDTVGNSALYLEVHPKLGTQLITAANETHTMLLCDHDWVLRVIFQDNQYTTTTMATGYTGPIAFLNASGTSGLCTTPIT